MLGRFARWIMKRANAAAHAHDATKRAALRAQPFPAPWRAHVAEVAQTRQLSPAHREKLEADILTLLGEKEWFGDAGFVLDDRARVIVATCASLVILGRDVTMFDHVRKITIVPAVAPDVGGHYETDHTHAEITLAWSVLESNLKHAHDGQNTPFHEFAHAFDDADGKLDALQSHPHYARWTTLLRDMPLRYEVIGNQIRTEIIGDVDGPELFASASELFFECPKKLHDLDAALFDTLVEIYGYDPRPYSR